MCSSLHSQQPGIPARGGAQADRPGHQVSRLLFLRGKASSFCCSNMIFFATSTCKWYNAAAQRMSHASC